MIRDKFIEREIEREREISPNLTGRTHDFGAPVAQLSSVLSSCRSSTASECEKAPSRRKRPPLPQLKV